MVLVRKTELACRNSWDQDLWDADDGTTLHPASPQVLPLPLRGGAIVESPPGPMALMTADEALDRLRTGDMYTDKVTSISMPLRPSAARNERFASERVVITGDAGTTQPVQQDSASDSNDSRSAVREARRRQQEQRKVDQRMHQQRLIREAGSLLGVNDSDFDAMTDQSIDSGSEAVEFTQPASLASSPVTHEPVLPEITASDIQGSATMPERHLVIEPTTHRDEVRFSGAADRFRNAKTNPGRADKTKHESHERRTDRPTNRPATADTPMQSQHNETEPLPIAELNAVLRATEVDARAAGEFLRHWSGPVANQDRPVTSFPSMEPPVPSRPQRWITGAGSIPLSTRRSDDAPGHAELPGALPVDPIDRSNELHAVPRCCGTCRDFKRQNESGQGWCTNPYAFVEQHMVESDGLACRSSVGLWWLPHDDLWLERADTTHHGRPTPLLDGMAREAFNRKQEIEPRSS